MYINVLVIPAIFNIYIKYKLFHFKHGYKRSSAEEPLFCHSDNSPQSKCVCDLILNAYTSLLHEMNKA